MTDVNTIPNNRALRIALVGGAFATLAAYTCYTLGDADTSPSAVAEHNTIVMDCTKDLVTLPKSVTKLPTSCQNLATLFKYTTDSDTGKIHYKIPNAITFQQDNYRTPSDAASERYARTVTTPVAFGAGSGVFGLIVGAIIFPSHRRSA